ncbi:hypothetical protein NDU88_004102 [Pleurodeles waltl]|uniref:Uncharacterized protein n=1 Tax=Pleurodeles waltl TaxID=8319 RepID=A0AAV7W9D5_PLEWA|nr:hypothetical protein NDU88_004102 [Pleurodeles waltl]
MLHDRAAVPCMHGSQVGWGALDYRSSNIQPAPEAHMFSAYLWERTVDSVTWAKFLVFRGGKAIARTSVAGLAGQMGQWGACTDICTL